jgi:isopenicillin N synthase-like dioxygenase
MGDVPPQTDFKQLNAKNVVPSEFKGRWEKTMNMWGGKMLSAIHTVSEMAAVGFGLEQDAFSKLQAYGPHLLAPTGSNLKTNGAKGTVFASYHYDLNFLTIHGKSRYPGLSVWTRDGSRQVARMPAGCLLLQAGKQFEILTGGHVLCGFHEVAVSDATVAAIGKAKEAKRSLWRVSSTLFGHIASDNVLQPLGCFATKEANKLYPPIKAGDQVQRELNAIKLGHGKH